ncbi:hypothetical protein L1987_12872 [Smallanthus sonchifolius]|uniref:Uncharacterized protein n=1 Tax=Smallanthus sonchifolius TaxID=185202 RepID=A0ACB9JHN7_9ASTR|nr:hypothetical protein L1987_12872 [Smallanthus sonchifolius]
MASTTHRGKGKGKGSDMSLIENTSIKWNREDFEKICEAHCIDRDREPEFLASGTSATDVPDDKIALYAAFFLHCNFRIPTTKFIGSLLNFYHVHISQMHPMGLYRATHFEFSCRSQGIEPTYGWFNVFYKMVQRDSWFSFIGRGGKVKSHITKAPSSFHDWRERLFFIKRDVILLIMNIRSASNSLMDPEVEDFEGKDWYNTLFSSPAEIKFLHESALVATRMSRIWKRADKVSYYSIGGQAVDSVYGTLFNDPQGKMVWRDLTPGEPAILDRWADNFLFPHAMDSDASRQETSGPDAKRETADSSAARGHGDGGVGQKLKRLVKRKSHSPTEKVLHSPRGKKQRLSDSLKLAEDAALGKRPPYYYLSCPFSIPIFNFVLFQQAWRRDPLSFGQVIRPKMLLPRLPFLVNLKPLLPTIQVVELLGSYLTTSKLWI